MLKLFLTKMSNYFKHKCQNDFKQKSNKLPILINTWYSCKIDEVERNIQNPINS